MIGCIKYLVILYNFVFWVRQVTDLNGIDLSLFSSLLFSLQSIGVALLGTTIFLYVDSQTYGAFGATSEHYMTLFLLLMALGAVMSLVGFIGCCGAIRESTCVLATYFLLCVTMCVASGAAIWWSAQNADLMEARLHTEILHIVRNKYFEGRSGTSEAIVDAIQADFACCGVKNHADWATTKYNTERNNSGILDFGVASGAISPNSNRFKVPPSCCRPEVNILECDRIRSDLVLLDHDGHAHSDSHSHTHAYTTPPGIYSEGCLSKFSRYAREQWTWLIAVAALVIGVQCIAIIFSCCLCCAIRRSDDK